MARSLAGREDKLASTEIHHSQENVPLTECGHDGECNTGWRSAGLTHHHGRAPSKGASDTAAAVLEGSENRKCRYQRAASHQR